MTCTSTCWPRTDLDGFKEITPPGPLFTLYWNAEILDVNGIRDLNIIRVDDSFDVRFRIELSGYGWQCMGGDWKFDLRFDEQGGHQDFKLSDRLPDGALTAHNWKGCNTTCVEHRYTVPARTIEASVYEITAEFRLWCCDTPAAIVGFDSMEEWMWFE